MPRGQRVFDAHRLLRTLQIQEAKTAAPPLNMEKWRGQLRDIRNQLIKLRDKAEAELDRIERAVYDDEDLGPKEADKLDKLQNHMTDCVDYVADAINQIDLCL